MIKPRKNSSGRKHISKKAYVVHRGELTRVNNSRKHGIYTDVVKKSFEELDTCIDKWGRVLMVRFDLHLYSFTETNEIITKLIKRLRHHFLHKLGIDSFGYHWCREHNKAEAQHYHGAIWLDGDKFNTSNRIIPIIQEAWEALGGRLTKVPNASHYIDDAESRLKALYRLSYLSKSRTKGNRPKQTKDHGMSRFRLAQQDYTEV